MKRPELKPGHLIKFAYVNEDGKIRFSVAQTITRTKRRYTNLLKFKRPKTTTYVDAHLLDRYNTLMKWEYVIAWQYVDFYTLIPHLPEKYKNQLHKK